MGMWGSSDQTVEIVFGVLAALVILLIVFAVVLDLRGEGERVPRQWPRIVSWVIGIAVVACGVYFWWLVSRDAYFEWPSAWALGMPLTAIGILAVVRPRLAAWALAITTLPVATLGFPAVIFYAPPAFLAAGLLRAAIPGFTRNFGSNGMVPTAPQLASIRGVDR
jgi:hypothetical protein